MTSSSAANDPTTCTSRCKFRVIAGAVATSTGVGVAAGCEFEAVLASSLACEFAQDPASAAAVTSAARKSDMLPFSRIEICSPIYISMAPFGPVYFHSPLQIGRAHV